jgi:hypothetical protein
MAQAKCGEADFVSLFESVGPAETARRIDCTVRQVLQRRAGLEKKLGRQITGPKGPRSTRHGIAHPRWLNCEIESGVVLIGSDPHYWPGLITTAHRAFVKFCAELQPKIVIKNGDVIDGSTISRHPPIGWEKRPALIEEIEACQERLGEVTDAAKNAKFYWPLGNHDARFETRLATVAPEYAKVKGVHLQDHFGAWSPCWSLCINDDVVVKHRFRGGIHAAHNNVLWAGKTICTGHLHSLKVMPLSDYNGTRWGVDCGTMAEPYGPQFEDYTEQNPVNWRSGFIVLTFHRGRLLPPEPVFVSGDCVVDFRGVEVSV